jgi:hypothetical protein
VTEQESARAIGLELCVLLDRIRDVLDEELEVAQSAGLGQSLNDLADLWWAVLGSNQWPLPCETEVRGFRINDMRVQIPIATGTWYHVMSFDIT